MKVDLQIIENIVCQHYDINAHDLFKVNRKKEINEARQVFHYMARKYTKSPLSKIGEWSNRNHATVMHSVKSVNNLRETDKKYNAFVGEVEAEIIEASLILDSSETTIYNASFKIAREVMACRNKAELNQVINRLTPVL